MIFKRILYLIEFRTVVAKMSDSSKPNQSWIATISWTTLRMTNLEENDLFASVTIPDIKNTKKFLFKLSCCCHFLSQRNLLTIDRK